MNEVLPLPWPGLLHPSGGHIVEGMESLCVTNIKPKTHNFLLKALVPNVALNGLGQVKTKNNWKHIVFFFPHRPVKYLFSPYCLLLHVLILLHVPYSLKIINNFYVEQKWIRSNPWLGEYYLHWGKKIFETFQNSLDLHSQMPWSTVLLFAF